MDARTSFGIAALGARGLLSLGAAPAPPPATHEVPRSKDGNVVIALCDGETTLEVKGVKDPAKIDKKQAQDISDQLMAEWIRKNPDANWDPTPPRVALAQPPTPPPAAPSDVKTQGESATSDAAGVARKQGAQEQSGHTYGAFSERD
ncbi:MAG: cytochrome C, partial [Cystobacter sp.]